MHLDIVGVKGESQVKGYADKIQILAWSWGLSQTGTTHHGTGGGGGKVNVQDLSFTHYVDNSSPSLVQACCTGKHFDKATLTMVKAGGDMLPYYTLTMEHVIVTSVSGGGSNGEDQQTENVTLNFATFTLSYQKQSKTGAKEGGANEVKFNIAQNAA
jgi:type VI secretion system secreted protein Hcp